LNRKNSKKKKENKINMITFKYLKKGNFENTNFDKDYKFFFYQINEKPQKNLDNYKVYKIKEKNFQYFLKLKKWQSFLITNSSIWKIYNDQPIGFHCLFPKNLNFSEKKVISGNFLNPSLILGKSGFFLQKNGSEIIFQSIFNTFLTQTSLIKQTSNHFLKKNEILGYELTYKKQAKDIVQGLPKVESLIEAYSNKNDTKEINRSSIFFSKQVIKTNEFLRNFEHVNFQSIFTNEIIICYKRLFYKLIPIPFQYTFKKNNFFIDHKTLFKSEEDENFYELENYSFIDFNTSRKLEYQSKIIDITNPHEKYYQDKYWPIYSDSLWIYKLQKFRLFKWLKLNPIIWIPGISKYVSRYFTSDSPQIGFVALSKSLNSNIIVQTTTGKYYFLELLNVLEKHNFLNFKKIQNHHISFSSVDSNSLKFEFFNNYLNFIYLGETAFQNSLNIQKLLNTLFSYHLFLDGSYLGISKSVLKFQTILALSIEDSYRSQGVKISSKNIEIIVKQMIDKVIIEDPKGTNLLPFEILKLIIIKQICKSINKYNNIQYLKITKKGLLKDQKKYQFENFPIFKPKLFSATSSIFYKEGFLTQAGFQNTKKVLTKSAIEGSLDWLTNLKQRIIVGQVLPSGSTFFNSKYNLDSVYLLKKNINYYSK